MMVLSLFSVVNPGAHYPLAPYALALYPRGLWDCFFRTASLTIGEELSMIMLIKSTTRHIRIFSADVNDDKMIPSTDKLTLDVDPDDELNWGDAALQSVYRKFDALVDSFAGEALTDYNLRCIGSDLEHFVQSLLQSGEVTYNLEAPVRNYSLGFPRTDSDITV